ncbi:lytic transglycosylase domain-containing protein [Enterovirga sp.]|uniref:lytic transglycosylase domain-containing protein n=1 Tax=Enterovirga sp. TaxID=2026350 RepID=UPI003455737D
MLDAIRRGAEATGTDFDYLLSTAKRESALDPSAKAPTSSATGLFQFIEQTWLGLLRSDGDRLGLGQEAKAVSQRPDGSLAVADPATRQALLDLRKDPELASVMAGALTRQNREALQAATGRPPSAGELYIAHVLGARGATDLISAAARDPTRIAAADFPDAARANRGIFYDRAGRPRGAGEVYQVLAAAQSGTSNAAPAPTGLPPPPAATVTGLNGMFQTGARTGPLSDAVARIWRTNHAAGSPVAVASFFPRNQPRGPEAGPSPAPEAALGREPPAAAQAPAPADVPAPVRADIPLPPVRPAGLGAAGTARPLVRPDWLLASQGVRP